MMPPPSTPLHSELVEHAFEYLQDDTASLKACSLVSRQWSHGSRRYLFYKATFTRRPWGGNTADSFSHIEQVIQRISRIGHHIRDLTLICTATFWEAGPVDVCRHGMEDLLLSLPCLKTLFLTEAEFSKCNELCRRRPIEPFRISLDVLTLHSPAETRSFTDVIAILRLFRHVKQLKLERWNWCLGGSWASWEEFDQQLTNCGTLSQLCVERLEALSPAPHTFFRLLRLISSIHSLRCISSVVQVEEDAAALGQLIHLIGHNLSSLRLEVMPYLKHSYMDWGLLSTKHCTMLASLELGIEIYPAVSDLPLFWEFSTVLDGLATFSESHSLRHVTLSVSFSDASQDVASTFGLRSDWNRMTHILSRHTFPSLECVRFRFPQYSEAEARVRFWPIIVQNLGSRWNVGMLALEVENARSSSIVGD